MGPEIARARAEGEIIEETHGVETAKDGPDWAPAFLLGLSQAIDDAGIRWLVLRNQADLPDRIGHDVDILVHPEDHSRIDEIVRAAVRDQRLFLVRVYRGIEHHTFDVAAWDLSGRLLLHVDVQTAVRYRGRLLVDAEDLLEHRRRVAGFWALTPGMEAYALVIHAALHKGALKEKYADRLRKLEDEAPGELVGIATERLGGTLGNRLASVRTEPELLAIRGELGRSVDRRYPGNRWRRPWFNVESGIAMTRRRLRPRGVFVVFLGPDGSGKSSTTDLLAEMLRDPSNVIPVHRVYLGSGTPLLPTRKLMQRVHAKSGRRQRDRQQLRDVRPRRLRGALHVMTDEILRYWVQVRPRLAPHGIVVADRYAYDVLRVNNETVRRPWFRRLATAIIPAPDITFFLEGDPATIAARKQELTLAETIRQQQVYRELASFVPNFRSLDLTVRDVPALRRVAVQILNAFAARNDGLPSAGDPGSAS